MKKNIKTLAAFLLLFAVLFGTTPFSSSINTENKLEISLCNDDDEDRLDSNVIKKE